MVKDALLWWSGALAAGPVAGLLVARAASQLPQEAGLDVPSRRWRPQLAVAACTLVSLWAMLLSPGLPGLVSALLGWVLVLLALLDAEHFWLPHRLTVPLGALGLAQAAAFAPEDLLSRLIGAAVGFSVLWLLGWAYLRYRKREGLGGGDLRLLAAAGAWVGWIGLPSVLVIASLSGLAMAGVMALAGRRPTLGQETPFGVFLSIGLWLTWLYGPLGLAER